MSERRAEVEAFADAMEAELRANDHKTGWKDMQPDDLVAMLWDEVRELDVAVQHGSDPSVIRSEAADVANFAMMVADVCGGLERKTDG